jgi:hypothetical protein
MPSQTLLDILKTLSRSLRRLEEINRSLAIRVCALEAEVAALKGKSTRSAKAGDPG